MMGIRLARIWAWLAVILPAGFGVLLLLDPQSAAETNSPETLALLVGIRQLVYSLMLLVAIFIFPNRVVGLLVGGRGLTDLADGIAGVATTGAVAGPVLFPLITSVISFAAAYFLYYKAPSAGTSSGTSARR